MYIKNTYAQKTDHHHMCLVTQEKSIISFLFLNFKLFREIFFDRIIDICLVNIKFYVEFDKT
jgi:hypothetical protein